jgi:hypothetical protein
MFAGLLSAAIDRHARSVSSAGRSLRHWRAGAVALSRHGGRTAAIGILQDGQKRWHRLKTHERFPAGWRITAINETELVVDGDTCEPGNGRGNEKERIKMNLRIMLWLLAFSHPLWAAAPKPVTLVVDDVPVVQVLQALVAQENRNLVVSPDVSGTLSLNLTRVPGGKRYRRSSPAPGSFCARRAAFFMCIPRPGSVNSGSVQNRNRRVDSLMRRWSLTASLFLCGCRGAAKSRGKTPEPKGSLSVDKRTNRLLIRDNQAVVDTLQRWAARWIFPSSRSSWRRIL